MATITDIHALQAKLDELGNEGAQLVGQLAGEVESLPDNPAITRSGGVGFTIKSSSLFGDKNNPQMRMDPFFHDFKAQYRWIADRIRGGSVDGTLKFLERLIAQGKMPAVEGTKHFHPTVIENIRTLLN